ncbi:SPOSA6832_04834, partial [Sporobolomyces salmonicolor]
MSSATAPSSIRLLLLGATGETGRQVLASALSSPAVHTFGRSTPKTVDQDTPGFSKLVHTSLDYEKLLVGEDHGAEAKKLKEANADVVLCTLGTTRKTAGSAEAFEKIDREYVLKYAVPPRSLLRGRLLLVALPLSQIQRSHRGGSRGPRLRPDHHLPPGSPRRPWRKERRPPPRGEPLWVRPSFSSVRIETPLLGRALVNAAIATGELAPRFAQPEKLAGGRYSVVAVNNANAMKLGSANEEELRQA